MTMTNEQIAAQGMKTILNDERLEKLFMLKFRWEDEKEYEDFADFEKVVEDLFNATNFKFVSMTENFLIKTKCEIRDLMVTVKINNVSYRVSVGA